VNIVIYQRWNAGEILKWRNLFGQRGARVVFVSDGLGEIRSAQQRLSEIAPKAITYGAIDCSCADHVHIMQTFDPRSKVHLAILREKIKNLKEVFSSGIKIVLMCDHGIDISSTLTEFRQPIVLWPQDMGPNRSVVSAIVDTLRH